MTPHKSWQAWTRPEIDYVIERTRQGASARLIAEEMAGRFGVPRSKPSVEDVRRRHGAGKSQVAMVRPVAEYRPPEGPTLAEVFAPEGSRDETEEEFLARVRLSASRSLEKAAAQKYARIRIASAEPVALSISSDWHCSTSGTHIDGLLAMADYVAAAPNMYAIAVGDLLDNPIKHRGGSVGAVADELRLLDLLVGRFRGKLLGTTTGNHDDWSRVLAGTNHIEALARRHRIHQAPDELQWTVEIVNPADLEEVTATYHIATRHQWRAHSGHNPMHSCTAWLKENVVNWDPIPDVIAIGHNHVAAVAQFNYERKDIWFARPGAWQYYSKFGASIGFAGWRATAPTVVMAPRRIGVENTIRVESDPVAAMTYMRGMARAAA